MIEDPYANCEDKCAHEGTRTVAARDLLKADGPYPAVSFPVPVQLVRVPWRWRAA